MFFKGLKDNSGNSAVEFAIIAPAFLFMIMSMIAYGIYFGALHSVQQVAANAARAALAGLDMAEREELARTNAYAGVTGGGLLKREPLQITVEPDANQPDIILVTVTYDASHLPIWEMGPPLPLPGKEIRRVSAIRAGGY